MGDIIKNKKVMAVIVSLILAGVSALVGYSVKDEVCGVVKQESQVLGPAAVPAAPAPPK